MALTPFQRRLCRLLAQTRIASGESYVAGGVALNELLAAPRLSRDIDLFHHTEEALRVSWDVERAVLTTHGFQVTVLRERPSYVEAPVAHGDDVVRVEWARDSAFRFFPLVQHPDLGLVLHPFDLATNKVLALVGRLEPRDWIDGIECNDRLAFSTPPRTADGTRRRRSAPSRTRRVVDQVQCRFRILVKHLRGGAWVRPRSTTLARTKTLLRKVVTRACAALQAGSKCRPFCGFI